MSCKTISIIAAALFLTLFGANAASAQGWDSDLSDGMLLVESNYTMEDLDPDYGVHPRPVTYFAIGGDQLYVLHAGYPLFFIPYGELTMDQYWDAMETTVLEWLEEEGFEWDSYDLEDVQEIVFLGGGEVNERVNNMTDIPSVLHGGLGEDWLTGGSSSDTIYGYEGDDGISGGAGDDVLIGGAGIDKLWGDDGADYLDFGFDTFEKGELYLSSGRIDTIVVNYEKSSINRKWYSKFPTFQSYAAGAMQYSDSYLNQHATIKKRYITRYGATFYNPDLTRTPSGIDTSQIDLRR